MIFNLPRKNREIYFAAQSENQLWQIWRVESTGGLPEQMTTGGGFEAHESPDGKYLYFNKAGYGSVGIFRRMITGDARDDVLEEKVLDLTQVDSIGEWIVTGTGIFFLYRLEPDNQLTNNPRIRFYDFATQQISDVFSLPLAPLSDPCLNLSPAKDWFYYSQNDTTLVDIMMLDRFGENN